VRLHASKARGVSALHSCIWYHALSHAVFCGDSCRLRCSTCNQCCHGYAMCSCGSESAAPSDICSWMLGSLRQQLASFQAAAGVSLVRCLDLSCQLLESLPSAAHISFGSCSDQLRRCDAQTRFVDISYIIVTLICTHCTHVRTLLITCCLLPAAAASSAPPWCMWVTQTS
jgi:hypothetical protein